MGTEDVLAQLYPNSFFEQTTCGSLIAARMVLRLLWQRRKFKSVVDVGCGVGTWLSAARELGASQLRGIDGPHVPREMMLVDPDLIVRTDLEQPLELAGDYDLCLCLEVAEHLSRSRASSLIAELTCLSGIVAFAAAIPFQGGEGHLNEMWPEYWAEMFASRGFTPWTGLRREIWNIREIPWWYRQNLIVYIRNSELNHLVPDHATEPAGALTLIHPESYLFNVRREAPAFKTSYSFDLDVYYECTTGRPVSGPGYGPEFPAPRLEESDS